MRPRTVLVTAFEPFDGQPVNASAEGVGALADAWNGPERLVTALLPVTFAGSAAALREAVAEHAPDLVVGVGEAPGRDRVSLERVAINVVDARIPDNDGAQPVDVPVVDGAPTAHLTGLPVKACVAALESAGIAAEVSNTAGTYVCNAVFFTLMDALAATPGVRGGFVHVPRGADGPATARALAVVVRTSLTTEVDVPVPGGREA
ncbi:pyroglutamyl-peptidase I [Georgenia faecalis]|uniref:Pyroglutamyl-peptidase I n=1 Tax=Georgenia faecalis TaxID=2483799 RepID=A0ABV9DC87_9MICO|nr:pyroglutamyl-peptidase I [Georgenia faecalis]